MSSWGTCEGQRIPTGDGLRFYHMEPRDWTHVIQLSGRHLRTQDWGLNSGLRVC